MHSLLAYSLLFLQLALVHVGARIVIPSYAVGSVKTNFWISDIDVVPGGDIHTAFGANGQPPDNAIYFRVFPKPGSSTTTNTSFYNIESKLYVGIDEPIYPGARLKWVGRQFFWEIANLGSYVIYPPGQDYYWFDNFSIPNVDEVEHGRNIMDGDFFWRFKSSFERGN
ncbi:hypothetical protein AX15_000773 [Amanita polypyramis BW_CC]|nr:hypothetical protein AX15_000773 [Amanita polypyramis BW_CC]